MCFFKTIKIIHNVKIQCYKCKKNMECNPKGTCWCKNLSYKIPKKNIEKNKKCLCEECLKEKLEHL